MDLEVERGFSDLHEQQREFSVTYPPDMDVTVEKNLIKFHNGALFDKEPIIQLIYPTHDYTIVVFCVILAFGVFSNLYLLVRCLRPAKAHWRKARVYLLHVVVANLFICVFAIPVEIGWRWTIEWRGGNVGCKMLQFARVFGLYALAHILMAVAVDKVIEVRQLMKGDSAANSTKYVFAASWILTTLCSFPQVLVFHAGFSNYSSTVIQCVSIESFTSLGHEDYYNIFMLAYMFIIPWTIMIACYLYIFYVVKPAQELPDDVEQYALTSTLQQDSTSSQMRARVFSAGQESRSSVITSWSHILSHNTVSTSMENNFSGDLTAHIYLRSSEGMFIVLDDDYERDRKIFRAISATAIMACLPFVAFTIWFLIDSHSHSQIHPILQELPYVMVLANTLLIPAVYAFKFCVTY